jgi:hypothetical protein
MNNISNMFINAVLADAAYVDDLVDGISGDNLKTVLGGRMTPVLAQFIADNFGVVAHKESDDFFGSGFDATVWRGRASTTYEGQVLGKWGQTELPRVHRTL